MVSSNMLLVLVGALLAHLGAGYIFYSRWSGGKRKTLGVSFIIVSFVAIGHAVGEFDGSFGFIAFSIAAWGGAVYSGATRSRDPSVDELSLAVLIVTAAVFWFALLNQRIEMADLFLLAALATYLLLRLSRSADQGSAKISFMSR